jgi:peptide chain release factor 3
MQVFYLTTGRREPLAGVVGALQFDVIVGRLRTEYGVTVEIEPAAYAAARWVAESDRAAVAAAGGSAMRAVDRQERLVLLFASEWELQYFQRQHPAITLLAESPVGPATRR